jgi:hypothetical protein
MNALQLLLLAISLEFSVYGQASWPDPAHLASGALSDNMSITTDWSPNRGVTQNNIRLLPEVYKNIEFADVNGDGYPDLCFPDTVLASSAFDPPFYWTTPVIKCALGSSLLNIQFSTPTVWSTDASGYTDVPRNWGQGDNSIQLVDINGDGRADICTVFASSAYVRCMMSNGSSFTYTGAYLSNTIQVNGATFADHADAVRFVDLDHDGKADVCMRVSSGIKCALSNGSTFGNSQLWSADFSDSNNWGSSPAYWSTIQFADLNGDGLPDVCGRSSLGMTCALNNGNHVSPSAPSMAFVNLSVWTNQFSDAYGWNQLKYYSTIQLADVNGDGKADVCGRGTAGIYCTRSAGTVFGNAGTLQLIEFSDANGWDQEPYYRSVWLVDVNNDGRADVCGRGYSGIWCALGNPSYDPSFTSAQLWISNFGNNYGWGSQDYYWRTVRPIHGSPQQVPMTAFCGRGGAGIWCSFSFGPRGL